MCSGSYGSTKRYKSFERLRKVNEQTVIGAGGELSDFQYILTLLDELSNEDFCADDGAKLSTREIHAYLARVLYNRRSKCVTALQHLLFLINISSSCTVISLCLMNEHAKDSCDIQVRSLVEFSGNRWRPGWHTIPEHCHHAWSTLHRRSRSHRCKYTD